MKFSGLSLSHIIMYGFSRNGSGIILKSICHSNSYLPILHTCVHVNSGICIAIPTNIEQKNNGNKRVVRPPAQ